MAKLIIDTTILEEKDNMEVANIKVWDLTLISLIAIQITFCNPLRGFWLLIVWLIILRTPSLDQILKKFVDDQSNT